MQRKDFNYERDRWNYKLRSILRQHENSELSQLCINTKTSRTKTVKQIDIQTEPEVMKYQIDE